MSDLALLFGCAGRYAGHGINHQDQPFYGELELEVLYGRALALRYRATGIDGTSYHEERSWIAADAAGRLCLWQVSSNGPGCVCHGQRHGAAAAGTVDTVVFGNDHAEIAIDVWPNGQVGYRQAWTVPGWSSVRMSPVVS